MAAVVIPLQRRLVRVTMGLGVLALLGLAAASTRSERIAYAALQAGVGLISFGAAWWLHGTEVSRRASYVVHGVRLTGRRVSSVGYAFKAAGAAFALIGAWCAAMWLTSVLAGR